MTYEDAQKYITGTQRFGSKPGLERVGKLLELMGNPQDSLKFIHIAGTNGKGSTANAIAAALTQSGIKTGLYISPFVTDFCERIQIDGCQISHEELAAEVEYIAPFVALAGQSGEQPTEFEIITALAFHYYKKMHCEVVVLEVGLGGRFDATNIIKQPLVSVITAISLDHTDILGDTVGKIAFEKCGIIKNFGVTVTCPAQNTQALEVIMRICSERENTLIMPSLSSAKIIKEGVEGTDIAYNGINLHIPLAGRHQIANFITAYEVLLEIRKHGYAVSDENIVSGMARVRFPARMEILNRSPLILLDGAHNPSGAAVLSVSIKRYLNEKPVLVMGMLADKDYETAIATLAPLAKAYIAVKPDSPRALEPEKAAQTASKYCSTVFYYDNYADAFINAMNFSQGSPVVICGSLYLAGGMRNVVLHYFSK